MSGETAEAGKRAGGADEGSVAGSPSAGRPLVSARAEEAVPGHSSGPASVETGAPPSFLRRYRLPLALAVIAFCLYVGSIAYILLGRGQIA